MKILKSHEFKQSSFGQSRYDWDMLLDGQIRSLEQGKDFTSRPGPFKALARSTAKKRGLLVRTDSDGNGNVILQAYTAEENEQPEEQQPKRRRSSKKKKKSKRRAVVKKKKSSR